MFCFNLKMYCTKYYIVLYTPRICNIEYFCSLCVEFLLAVWPVAAVRGAWWAAAGVWCYMGQSSVLLQPYAPAAAFINFARPLFLFLVFHFSPPSSPIKLSFPADLLPVLIILLTFFCFDARVFEEAIHEAGCSSSLCHFMVIPLSTVQRFREAFGVILWHSFVLVAPCLLPPCWML